MTPAFTRSALFAVALLAGLRPISGAQDKPAPAPVPAPAPAPTQEKTVAPTADAAVDSINKFIADQKIDKQKSDWRTKVPKPPQATFDPKKTYYWVVETNVGTLKVKLLPDAAPMHVSACIYLTNLGFYDTLKFHRVIQNFMAQGGDPLGNGRGGPAYMMKSEFKAGVTHSKAGMLSAANAGEGTDGSQFFLTFVPTSWLDGKHTIYGEVSEGLDTTVKELEKRGSADSSGRTSEPLFIKKATIEVK
jgi:peptidyl-prolyl cis-trans isomerase B (cyclophilin B)